MILYVQELLLGQRVCYDTERLRETQKDTESYNRHTHRHWEWQLRETIGDRDIKRETLRNTERHRKTQKDTERHRKTKRSHRKTHREKLRGTERDRVHKFQFCVLYSKNVCKKWLKSFLSYY